MEPFHLILDYTNLFEIFGEYQYFKIILASRFDPSISIMVEWAFGKAFFKEFLMTFNKDAKTITFYSPKEKSIDEVIKIKNNNKNIALLMLVVILIILVFIIFYLLRKCVKQQIEIKKRKRKNNLVSEMAYYSEDKD